MAADGYISGAQAKKSYDASVKLNKKQPRRSGAAGYYLGVVKKRARAVLGMPLQRAGAHIYTHLDQAIQIKALAAVRNGIKGKKPLPQAALVCLETTTARVRALVGGTSYSESPFDRATQARRPAGSVFKPFVYGAALKKGWSPESVIYDSPLSITGKGGKQWRPKNYSGTYHGATTLGNALAYSYNTAAVRLLQRVGVKEVQKFAKGAGINSKMSSDLSLALGTTDVSLLEMTAAYVVFAGDGTSYPPSFIDKIVSSNGSVHRFSNGWRRETILKASELKQMQSMLSAVVRVGTGKRVISVPGVRGGKTGTTNDNRDAWFVGYDAHYTTGIWVGNDRNQSLGKNESGGATAAPIWRDFMLTVKGE